MNISILVFGSKQLITKLPDQIRGATAFTVEAIANLNQAVSYIQTAPPDVILVQASSDGSMELCYWLKEQTKLSWIYCILLEDRPHILNSRSIYGREWELEMTCAALKQGADAYIWFGDSHTTSLENEKNASTANEHLLLAQLTVGLRKAQKYRDLIRTNDLLSAIALADSLTEFSNRRALEWDLPRQIQNARTKGTSLSLIILDVDHFKQVNDTYGHLVGDRLLQLLCNRLRHNLRFQDTPFRYGGEEFVIILANTSCEEAHIVAARLNHVVKKEPFAISNTLSINITISLGATCLEIEDDDQGISMLDRADKYLLNAKAAGRNRVISCDSLRSHSHQSNDVSLIKVSR